jgi:transposase
MKRLIEGVDRTQSILFPARLDEYIAEDNCTRVIDAFIDTPNLKALGFDGAVPADTGRPAFHPAILLRIFVYGYLRIHMPLWPFTLIPSRNSLWD